MNRIPEPFHWRTVAKEMPSSKLSVIAYSEIEWGFSIVEWDPEANIWRSDAVFEKTYPRGYFVVWMYIPLLPKLLPEPYIEKVQ
jgi:hypothetical protein